MLSKIFVFSLSHQLFLYDSTMIAPFPLLFFGGEISVFVEEGYETVAVDDFIKFKSPTRIANLVKVGIIWWISLFHRTRPHYAGKIWKRNFVFAVRPTVHTYPPLTFFFFLFLPSQELRVELDKLLKQKIAQPEMKLSVGTGTGNKESALLRAIIDLITSEENTNWVRDWIDNRYLCH